MTEKRFTIDKDGITIIDNCTDGLTECKHSNEAYLLCNFLNEQHEENEQLKDELESFKPVIFESDGKPVTLYQKGDIK